MKMELSQRLQRIYELTGRAGTVADIGSDHGLLPVRLLADGRCRRAIAADISAEALVKARANAQSCGVEPELRVGDGLLVLAAGEADTVAVAGMGGELMAGILERGADRLCGARLVLSPNNGAALVRGMLVRLGYAVTDEDIVRERDFFYQIMAAEPGKMLLTEDELEFGAINLARRHPLLLPLVRKRAADARKMRETAGRGQSDEAHEAGLRAGELLIRYGRLEAWLSE